MFWSAEVHHHLVVTSLTTELWLYVLFMAVPTRNMHKNSEGQTNYVSDWSNLNLVQFSCSVMSNSLWPHEPQHARPPCPSLTAGVLPNPCPSSQWCHPTISSSVVPFSSCPQSFRASGSFQMSQLFTSGGQSTGVSASTSVLPMNRTDPRTDLL